jgi:hypothetical protein
MTIEEKQQLNSELLPIYEQVPVYKEAADLLIFTYGLSERFRRAHRYSLGEDMRFVLHDLLDSIYDAHVMTPRSPMILKALRLCNSAKLLYRAMDAQNLLRDWQCAEYIAHLGSTSKQLTAWYKYERKKENKDKTKLELTAPTGGT